MQKAWRHRIGEKVVDEEVIESPFRQRFVAKLGFPLDAFQVAALDLLDAGDSVLVAAPTGSGKTVVAEYAVARALEGSGRAFYTTPIKALSNQKYRDFARVYGQEKTGLLTGDISLNGDAPIVVMTTEILRNMIYASQSALVDLRCVVLDEVHFLEDRYRGAVWEEIILSAPECVSLVCLSATVSNASELAAWIEGVRGATGAIIEEKRPIELQHLYVIGDVKGQLRLFPSFVDGGLNKEALAADATTHGGPSSKRDPSTRRRPSGSTRQHTSARPRRIEVIERFGADGLLPAIYFVFSRAGCDGAVRQCLDAGVRLTNQHDRTRIRDIADRHVDGLSDADLRVLSYDRFVSGLEAGIAPHHAGLVPAFREAVEELFTEALVKVVFATETLALGINMPARSVIIESVSKFGGLGHHDLTPGEYTQLTGRAGRRGIDDIGYAAVLWSPFHTFGEVASIARAPSRALQSVFRPTYNMVVNLVRRYGRDDAYRLVASSFAQYLSDVPLTDQLDAVIGVLEARGYLRGWRVTEQGERLAGIYHDCDLLIAEALASGLFDNLDVPSLCALVSCFTFEARRSSDTPSLHSASLDRRYGELVALGTELRAFERKTGLPRTRRIDAGFCRIAFEWAKGTELRRLLLPPRPVHSLRGPQRGALSGGDFVRNVKQLVDLLRQIGAIEGPTRLGTQARKASEALVRGVVAASSSVGLDAAVELGDDPR